MYNGKNDLEIFDYLEKQSKLIGCCIKPTHIVENGVVLLQCGHVICKKCLSNLTNFKCLYDDCNTEYDQTCKLIETGRPNIKTLYDTTQYFIVSSQFESVKHKEYKMNLDKAFQFIEENIEIRIESIKTELDELSCKHFESFKKNLIIVSTRYNNRIDEEKSCVENIKKSEKNVNILEEQVRICVLRQRKFAKHFEKLVKIESILDKYTELPKFPYRNDVGVLNLDTSPIFKNPKTDEYCQYVANLTICCLNRTNKKHEHFVREPIRVLPCLHNACEECLTQVLNKQIKCEYPNCEQMHVIKSINEFEKNELIGKLVSAGFEMYQYIIRDEFMNEAKKHKESVDLRTSIQSICSYIESEIEIRIESIHIQIDELADTINKKLNSCRSTQIREVFKNFKRKRHLNSFNLIENISIYERIYENLNKKRKIINNYKQSDVIFEQSNKTFQYSDLGIVTSF